MPLDGTNRLALPRVEIRLPVALEDFMIPTLVAALLFAQPSPPAQTPPRTVHASGEGRISVAPDIARVTIGVEAQDQSLARANADATTRMG